MRWTIARTLFAVLVLTSLVTLSLNAVISQWQFQRDFLTYTGELDAQVLANLTPAFASHYTRHGTWADLQEDLRVWRQLVVLNEPRRGGPPPRERRGLEPPPRDAPPRGAPPRGAPPGGERGPGTGDPLDIANRIGLYDANGNHLVGAKVNARNANSESIRSDNRVVGELRLATPKRLTNQLDRRFAAGQRGSLFYVALAVLGLAVLAAMLLAKRLTKPISILADRASSMTAGDFTPRVEMVGSGEIAELAADLNNLAMTLDSNQRSRRQWISDISHELRTPLAIMMAELQALEDGVRKYDDASRASLQTEVNRLNRLVHDLYELSMSDEGRLSMHPEPLDIKPVLTACLINASPRLAANGIELLSNFDEPPAIVYADSARLGQLFNNLIENSLRYTDDPGRLVVSVQCIDDNVSISFDDSAPGVPDKKRDQIFDRLFRVDSSRSRDSGGSGLGLSICSAIVDAHKGAISAEESSLGGLSVRVTFPLHKTPDGADD